jgi:hypothetical protein
LKAKNKKKKKGGFEARGLFATEYHLFRFLQSGFVGE